MNIHFINKNVLNRKRIVSKFYIPSLLFISLVVACGDFVDKPAETVNPPDQPQTTPVPKKEPETPTQQDPKKTEKEMSEMCEAERTWAYSAGLIDARELRLYRGRNLAPVYQQPGNRQSSIEGWYPCEKALQANGFYPDGYQSFKKQNRMEHK